MQVAYESDRKADSVDCNEYFFFTKHFSWNPQIIALNRTVIDSYWLFFVNLMDDPLLYLIRLVFLKFFATLLSMAKKRGE